MAGNPHQSLEGEAVREGEAAPINDPPFNMPLPPFKGGIDSRILGEKSCHP